MSGSPARLPAGAERAKRFSFRMDGMTAKPGTTSTADRILDAAIGLMNTKGYNLSVSYTHLDVYKRQLSGRKALFARTTAVACSVSRGRYSLRTKLVVTEVSNEAFAFSASGVQNSMSNISMLRKLLIKSLFLANVDNICLLYTSQPRRTVRAAAPECRIGAPQRALFLCPSSNPARRRFASLASSPGMFFLLRCV